MMNCEDIIFLARKQNLCDKVGYNYLTPSMTNGRLGREELTTASAQNQVQLNNKGHKY